MKAIEDESGQTVVVVAAFLGIVALGFLALALDVGYLFRERQMVQTAADAAAVAAAEEAANGTPANEQTVANAVATLNGFDTSPQARNRTTVTFPTPAGNFTGGNYVAVTVSKPVSTFFMGVFSSRFATQTVSATATAGGGTLSQTCVCLGGSSGTTLTVNGNSHLTTTSCGIVDNSSSSSSVEISGSGSVTTASLGLSSSSSWTSATIKNWYQSPQIDNSGSSLTLNGVANTYYSNSTYPVPGVSNCAPTLPSAITPTGCVADPTGGSSGPAITISPGCYNSLAVGENGRTVTLTSGIYVITGSLHFYSQGNLGGNGVFFYLTSTGSLTIDNGANINLVAGGSTENGGGTAPSVGAGYDGIAIYQATGNATAVQIQGGSNSYIGGAIYAPSAALSVGNGSSMTLPMGGFMQAR